jgi:hypothetical protein
MDGRTLTASTTESNTFSGPLVCMLSNSEKMIPSYLCNNIRLLFTIDSLANMYASTAVPSAFAITNFEVVYNMISMPDVESHVMNSQIPFSIKSNSYATSSYPLPSTAGAANITLPFSISYSSIRAAYFHFCGLSVNQVNGYFDSTDPTNPNFTNNTGGGAFQIGISGQILPQKALNSLDNKAGILTELYRTQQSIYNSQSMSINTLEFFSNTNTATTAVAPGKFILGFNLNVVSYNNIFSGLNTNNTPVNLLINSNTAMIGHTVILNANYDCLLQFDPSTKQIMVVK